MTITITIPKELLEQLVGALEQFSRLAELHGDYFPEGNVWHVTCDTAEPVIKAGRAALEGAERDTTHRDAELWRAYKARKDAAIAHGLGRNPMRSEDQSTRNKLLRKALFELQVVLDSDYGRKWIWPDTAHEARMKTVNEVVTAIKGELHD